MMRNLTVELGLGLALAVCRMLGSHLRQAVVHTALCLCAVLRTVGCGCAVDCVCRCHRMWVADHPRCWSLEVMDLTLARQAVLPFLVCELCFSRGVWILLIWWCC